MLKVLILKKAQEDLAREQAEKDAAKFEAIGEIVPPLDIEGYEEGETKRKVTLILLNVACMRHYKVLSVYPSVRLLLNLGKVRSNGCPKFFFFSL